MPKMKQSASDKAQYSAYKHRFETNKHLKLERTAKAQPNNTQAQSALLKADKNGIQYTRNRKSNGHPCKGLYNKLGFDKNQLSEGKKKSKLELQHFCGILITNSNEPNHGSSMCKQLEALGYEKQKYVRKHKKTTR